LLTALATIFLIGCGGSDILEDLNCSPGQVATFDGRAWACADLPNTPQDSDTLGALSCTTDQIAAYDGMAWVCTDQPVIPNPDGDTLATLNCAANDIIVFNGTEWVCGTDQDFLGQLTCNRDDVLTYDGTNWVCSENIFRELIPTRADAIATPVTDSRSDNSLSINLGATDDFPRLEYFPNTDGSGIIAWNEGDDGQEYLYLAYYGPDGEVVNQSLARGTYGSSPFNATGRPQLGMVVVWAPSGDASIAFIAGDGLDPGAPQGFDRVFFGTFRRGLARVASADTGERYGFSEFAPIDNDNDQDVQTLFVATNRVDGAWSFTNNDNTLESLDRMYDLLETTRRHASSDRYGNTNRYFVTGERGDAPSNLTPMAFIGWLKTTAEGGRAAAGIYLDPSDVDGDLDDADTIGTTPLPLPLDGLDSTESIATTVLTSGTDMLLRYTDQDGSGQDRLFLVRAIPPTSTAPSVGAPVEITRGTNSGSASTLGEIHAFVGDGYRAINGESTAWIVYEETGYADGTVTAEDRDVLIAQVDASGTVSVGEFDHNPIDAATGLDASDVRVQIQPGATRAFVYYRQQNAATIETDISLHVRALRLDGTQSLASNVSNELTVNDTHDTTGDDDSDILEYTMTEHNAFYGNSANNDASYVAYRQEVEGDSDGESLKVRLLSIVDSSANPIVLAQQAEEMLVANHDRNWVGTAFGSAIVPVRVLPGSSSDGRGIVTWIANGNSPEDNNGVGAFEEQRPFIYAPSLPNGHAIATPTQFGSDSAPGLLPQANWRLADWDRLGGNRYLFGPWVASDRDFAHDFEENLPARAIFLIDERLGHDNQDEGGRVISRTLDLRDDSTLTSVDARWSPALTELPDDMGPLDGESTDDLDHHAMILLPQGDDVISIFNVGHNEDSGPGEAGYIYINTFNDGAWSDAALLSNDDNMELDDDEEPFPDTDYTFGFVPSFVNGTPQALGAWTFWVRWQWNSRSSDARFELRGRRIIGTVLPRR
ncbi:MAG: hypothetical protein AAF658_02445, partial [Myxococcota bacterium]